MTGSSPNPVRPLAPTSTRAMAAAALGTATQVPPFACSLLVDALDAVSWAVLGAAGATPAEALDILSALWAPSAAGTSR